MIEISGDDENDLSLIISFKLPPLTPLSHGSEAVKSNLVISSITTHKKSSVTPEPLSNRVDILDNRQCLRHKRLKFKK